MLHEYACYHIAALTLGFALDRVVGDPYSLPHPIRAIGNLIAALDKAFMDKRMQDRREPGAEGVLGCVGVAIVLGVVAVVTSALFFGAYWLDARLGVVVEAILTFYVLAGKSLRVECMKVHNALKNGSLADARRAVSMIVGRDVDALDERGVTRAAVETSAENLSDGAIAPWLYACVGGPVAAMLYKAVNTMDSMWGYHNDRYEYYGSCAARLDDLVNYIPARLSACFAIVAAALAGKRYDARRAIAIFRRDRFNHKSPNSAQTESVYAGAMGLRLAGDAYYFGRLVEKPFIGDELREIEADDIKRACDLTDLTTYLCTAATLAILIAFATL